MRIYMAGIFAMGFQIACQQSFMALGQAKVSLLLACLRKLCLLYTSKVTSSSIFFTPMTRETSRHTNCSTPLTCTTLRPAASWRKSCASAV